MGLRSGQAAGQAKGGKGPGLLLDFDRRRLSMVVEKDGSAVPITKGAPEAVLQVCSEYESQGSRHPLEDAQRKHCDETYRELSGKGLRVLAVAGRRIAPQD
jgi:P-type Mg2+ transporter